MLTRAAAQRHRLAVALVLALTTYAFWPVLGNGFVGWDDPQNFTENPHYRGLGWAQLKWMFTTFHMGPYIPLTWMSLAIDYLVWGLDPTGYHLTSLLLHAVNGVLFYMVAERVLAIGATPNGTLARTSPPGALVAALVFSVHPLRVESVAWATERRDVLCGFFFLISLVFHLESLNASGNERRGWRIGSLLAYLFSLLSKAASVPLPVLLVVLDAYVAKKRSPERALSLADFARSLHDKLAYFVLAIPFAAAAVLGQSQSSIMASPGSLGLFDRVAVVAYGVVFYVWKTVWPHGLSPFYQLPRPFNAFEPRFLIFVLLVLFATFAAVRVAGRRPAFLTAWMWYVVALLPTSGALQTGFQIAADRYTYLPCLGWAILAGAGVSRAADRLAERRLAAARSFYVAVACLIGGLVLATRAQTRFWHDSVSLWQRVVDVEPNSITGRNNFGASLAEQGRFPEAIANFRSVLERDPDNVAARGNLDMALRLTKAAGKSSEGAGDRPASSR
ncbi:MAG: hypothetical protein ACREQQ_06585 [Candidatus Binatia bacterium]